MNVLVMMRKEKLITDCWLFAAIDGHNELEFLNILLLVMITKMQLVMHC